ncbi:MAG: DUF5336 domain-containing protein [Mycobacterium sp.]
MTDSPGSPGYPPGQPTGQYAAPTQQFGKVDDGPGKLPVYLTAAVAVLGLAVYLASFGPYFTGTIGAELFAPIPLYIGIVVAILAGLLAAVSLVPKQPAGHAVVAVLAVLGFLLVMGLVITAPEGVSIDWGLYLIIAFTALQAIVAVVALLVDAGVIAPPAPRQKYDQQQQYGQYGGPGGYYGQPGQHAAHHGGPPQHQQRPGYPSQYGGHPGGPSTGGYSALPQSGPPTPPTGFPAYGQPQPSSAPTTQVPAQPQQSSSTAGGSAERPHGQQSGPTPS